MTLLVEKQTKIENMIYKVRGKQVMLDSDLAKLYGTETKRINEAVKNNPEKFPERFCFRIDKNETRGGRYKNPRVFTEQGVAMLATILKTKIAVQVSIVIMDAFVKMRHYLSNSLINDNVIEHKLLKHDKRISLLEDTFNNFKEQNNHIFYEGQIYDSYSLLLDIFETSNKNIIIIDNYADKKLKIYIIVEQVLKIWVRNVLL